MNINIFVINKQNRHQSYVISVKFSFIGVKYR